METIGTNPKEKSSNFRISIIFGCALLMAGVLTLDKAFPRGVAIDVLYIAPVLLSLRIQKTGSVILIAALCSVLTFVGFFLSAPDAELWKSIFNRFIAITAVWICVFFGISYQVIARKREKAFEEIKVLSGLLPICAWCKKVRDDQGYWNQIETYLSSRSHIFFSHGICPECRDKQLSEIASMGKTLPKDRG